MTAEQKVLELEAKLFAYRKVLQILLAEVAQLQENEETFWAKFDNDLAIQDHEEDPGVEPDPAYAAMSTMAFELERIVGSVRPKRPDVSG